MDLHTRWFRRLLRLLPADFQADYARDMERTFQAQRRDAQHERGGILRLWFETARDLLRTAPREHAEQFRQDAGYALRMMRRAPGFTFVAIATLALGIGANSAIFSIVDAVLLRPLPYPGSERIVRIHERQLEDGLLRNSASPPNVIDWQQQSDAFVAIAAYRPRSINVSGSGEPRYAHASRVSREFFQVLGVTPAIGRSFSLEEDRAVAKVVVLGHALWQAQFGGDPSVIGQTIDLDGEPFEVIGVMPADFGFQLDAQLFKFQRAAEMWMPLGLYPNPRLPGRGAHNLSVVARLKDGVSVSQAQAQMSAIASRLALQYPRTNKGWDVYVEPLHESVVHEVRTIAVIFAGAIGFVLLIACANIGSLLVARASSRGREFAVRITIGANRTRLARQIVTESLLLSLAGGTIGIALAAAAIAIVRGAEVPVPRLDEVVLNARALVATAGISMMAGLLFGMAPAWHVGRWELHGGMSGGARGGSAGSERRTLQALLSAAQVAIAIVLLAGAGVMVRTLWEVNRIDPGFRSQGVLTVDLTLSDARYPKTADAVRFFHDVVDAAAMVPGVRSAALVSDPPLTGGVGYWSIAFTIAGRPPQPPGHGDFAYLRWVTPHYFDTLGVPVLRGRMLAESDTLDRPGVVLVNAAFAERYFPGEDAVGRRINIQIRDNAPREIVGIVANVRQTSLIDPAEPQMYLSYYQSLLGSGTLLVRTEADPLTVAADIKRAVHSVDRQQALFNVRRLDDIVAASVAAERLTMRALAVFAGSALVLSLLGVYGVIAYSVRQRTQEIGVRMALGATRAAVLRLIVGDGIRLAAIGAAVGVVSALAVTRLLADLVYRVSPSDPGTLTAVVAILLLAAAAASLLPAWRATRIDPSTALRSE